MRVPFVLLLTLFVAPAWAAPSLDRLTLPRGFHIAVYSDQVPQARELALGANGTVFVGSMDAGKVYALTDADHDGFEQDEQSLGRPVDVQPLPDGSLLASDDQAGAVYRVTYGR